MGNVAAICQETISSPDGKMKVIDVFECYYEAECIANDRPRHAAKVSLTCTTDAGMVGYEWAVSFFPHNDPEDFAVSYDAYFSKVLYDAPGRRSKKREAQLLDSLQSEADALGAEAGGIIFWDKPLLEARRG